MNRGHLARKDSVKRRNDRRRHARETKQRYELSEAESTKHLAVEWPDWDMRIQLVNLAERPQLLSKIVELFSIGIPRLLKEALGQERNSLLHLI